MATPLVPPRPQRAQAGPTAVNQNVPQIPSRPVRKTDPSPNRENMTRSPLNLPPTSITNGKSYGNTGLSQPQQHHVRRPSDVSSMPSIGQEGIEYASFDQLPPEAHGVSSAAIEDDVLNGKIAQSESATVEQTRHANVPMHAPKASLPISTAKSRISTVTRTDSSQAAAAGIGKAKGEDEEAVQSTSASLSRVSSREPANALRAKASFNRSNISLNSGTPRPPSMHEGDHEGGIPMLGQQIPLYPNAGDVQAPSPAPGHTQFPTGIGFFNDGSSRAHHRKRSSRHHFGPPDSYGLHAHQGHETGDQFERDWLAKHPEVASREGYSFTPKPATALSSDELNRLVQMKADLGMGSSANVIGTPDQEVGYLASEHYTSRMNSPKPSPTPLSETKKRPSSSASTRAAAASPLQRASFPINDTAVHDDDDDDEVIHVDRPLRQKNKVTGGGDADGAIDLGPDGEEGGIIDEHSRNTPILASDEVIKRPGSAFMLPAVSPEATRTEFDHAAIARSRRGSDRPTSRPSSRPNSMHGNPLLRFVSHEDHQGSGMGTPLDEIEEYEPLFPEGEDGKTTLVKKLKARPGLAQHHFPSQDIWEDTPQSLQFTTSVETPEPPQQPQDDFESPAVEKSRSSAFETPEAEQRRREQNPDDMTSDNKTFVKPHFKPGVQSELHAGRPGPQRFPSRDIWEDTPDSQRLETTVSGPQVDEVGSPVEERAAWHSDEETKPIIPARPQKSSKLAQDITEDIKPEATSPTKTRAPAIPDRPKPSIPARPAKYAHSEQNEGAGAPLAKSTSVGSDASADSSVTSPPLPKAKPAVPARPAGNKFAGLKASFMNDLNSRLQVGPQAPAPKTREVEADTAAAAEEEKAPLADARKGRAKGPPRRKAAPSASQAFDSQPLSFSTTTMTLWHIDEADELSVPTDDTKSNDTAEKTLAANASANITLDASPATVASSSVSLGPATPLEKDNPLGTPQMQATTTTTAASSSDDLVPHTQASIGALGDKPDPSISPATLADQQAIAPGLAASLSQAERAPSSAEELQAKPSATPQLTTGEATADGGSPVHREDETLADA